MKYKRIPKHTKLHCESLLVQRTTRCHNKYKAHLLTVRCKLLNHCLAWYFECRLCIHNELTNGDYDNYDG